ncbi:MAG: histidine kinase [Desulfovibrio sp.]|nr:histidine kinase [Desulfovibrio sp.]
MLNKPIPTPSRPPAILLLSESDDPGNLDKRALREAGAGRIECMTSGVAACRLLAGPQTGAARFFPDLVVCTQRLADMSGEQFCAILRLHPLLLDLPVLLILPHDNELEQLKTLGCGASALLARPYSVQTLKAHMDNLSAPRRSLDDLERAERLADTKAFDAALSTYGILLKPVRAPEDYFRVGMQCLAEGKWNYAINAFQKALRGALIRGKAELGMAAAWKGKGDMNRYRAYLAKAAATFVHASQWNRARAVYARLLQEDPDARSPFLAEAVQRIRQGEYEEAAAVLAQGYSLTPRKQMRDKLATVCLTAPQPDTALLAMENMLELGLGTDVAEVLGKEIRQTLDKLARQLEQRRQEETAERQRQARLAARRMEAKAQDDEKQDALSRNAKGAASGTPQAPHVTRSGESLPLVDTFDVPKGKSDSHVIANFEMDEGIDESGLDGLGDFLSVMKLTWRMARRRK